MPTLQLDPNLIRKGERTITIKPTSPEDSIGQAYASIARDRFLQEILSGEWEPTRTIKLIHDCVADSQWYAFQQSGRGKYMRVIEKPPLAQSSTGRPWYDLEPAEVAEWQNIPYGQVSFSPTFLDSVKGWFQQKLSFVPELDRILQLPSGRNLVDNIRALSVPIYEMVNGKGIDGAHAAVRLLMTNDEPIVSLSEAEALVLLTLLPYEMRFIFQELTINRCLQEAIGRTRGFAPDTPSDLVHELFDLDILFNHHWERLATQFGASPELTLQFVEWRGRADQVKDVIKRRLSDGESWQMLQKELRDAGSSILSGIESVYAFGATEVEVEAGRTPLTFWQYIDIGHAFCHVHDVSRLLSADDNRELTPRKCEQFAVVLEDDPKQLERWIRAIDARSSYSLLPDGAGLSCNPAEIISFGDDSRVGWFILDSEIFGDRRCGLDVALILMRGYVEKLERGHIPLPVSVTVWSSDLSLVKDAEIELTNFKERFEQSIQEQNLRDYFSKNFRVKVQSKLSALAN